MRWVLSATVVLVSALSIAIQAHAAFAQEPGRVYRLGVLSPSPSLGLTQHTIAGLARLGFVNGRNLRVEWRGADGRLERLPDLARELVEAPVEVIVAVSSDAIKAARAATSQTPIVMAFATDDPVATGIIVNFARPGGNITGVAMLAAEGDVKRLELLAEAIPSARRLAVLVPRTITRERLEQMQEAGRTKGIEIVLTRAANREEYDAAFDAIRTSGVAGLVVASYPNFSQDAGEIAGLATVAQLPTICHWREMAAVGCLFSYGPPVDQLGHRVADYVARILKGASPSEMPVEQPDRFSLVINLKTAKSLDLDIPASLLARADEVIE